MPRVWTKLELLLAVLHQIHRQWFLKASLSHGGDVHHRIMPLFLNVVKLWFLFYCRIHAVSQLLQDWGCNSIRPSSL